MNGEELEVADAPTVMEAELTVQEAVVIGVMRNDERARRAVFRYAHSFNE